MPTTRIEVATSSGTVIVAVAVGVTVSPYAVRHPPRRIGVGDRRELPGTREGERRAGVGQ